MSRLEVDVKSIQKIIRDRALRAQKILSNFEAQAEKTLKNLKKMPLYQTAFKAALHTKDELEKRASEAKVRVLDLLNVPTKEDLKRLNKKVDVLVKKLKTESQKVRRVADTTD
ncbi:MAG: hypothetical protein AAB309_06545 [Deltaproteobacteria bacterium]